MRRIGGEFAEGGVHGDPPPEVIPIGRAVIVPANGSLPNIILSPRAILRMRRGLAPARLDVLHLHAAVTPIPGIAAPALARQEQPQRIARETLDCAEKIFGVDVREQEEQP